MKSGAAAAWPHLGNAKVVNSSTIALINNILFDV
jgi:hypothetical protein